MLEEEAGHHRHASRLVRADGPPGRDPEFALGAAPEIAARLTGKGELGGYEISLPEGFTQAPNAKATPPGMAVAVFGGPKLAGGGTLISMTVGTSPQMLKETKAQEMRQTLVNYSAGMTNAMSLRIQDRGPTETGTIGGMDFTRFTWTTRGDNGTPAVGSAYGTIDGETVVLFTLLAAGNDPDESVKLMEASVASLKKSR